MSSSVAPMFPFYDNYGKWDDFGEVINPDDYVMKDDDMHHGLIPVDGDLNGKLDEAAASLIFDTTPSKVVSTELTVHVKCSLMYMDFEGRSDGRLIKSILSHVSPLKLVLVHGSAEATEYLKQHCLKNVCPYVYAPRIGETIDVTSDLCAYKVQLSEKLMSNVLFKKLGEYEVAWIDAEVGKMESGMLSLVPLSSLPTPHKPVLAGDVKISDFRKFLSVNGVEGSTAANQQIILEGPLTEEYFKIRQHLYSQFYAL